jgi:hypothetical protein
MKQKNSSLIQKAFFGTLMMLFGSSAFADPPDFSALTAAVDFSSVQSALLTVMATLAAVYIIMRGGSLILSKIRR